MMETGMKTVHPITLKVSMMRAIMKI
uniref:Uncharacterized protein n=1 Tax=Arundo donax TaxID=35708 RepID=A0A0A9DZC9_ARUDO